jgi:hypothetical protein
LDTIAKRPDTLVHNGAVRYIVNVLGNSIAQDHTRRGQPVPERTELHRQALESGFMARARRGETGFVPRQRIW